MVDTDYGRIEELEARVSTLETQTEAENQGRVNDLAALHATVSAVEPWVGPEGQLRVRLERVEQAIFALISDPNNPLTSAQRAASILTAIPAPPA